MGFEGNDGKEENVENGKGRFVDDGAATFDNIITEEDIDEASQIYGEGYEPLINCLKICWRNNMQTFACCSGHEYEEVTGNRNTRGYISFIVEDKELFNYIINKTTNSKQLYAIMLHADSEMEKIKNTQFRGKTEISFYCNYENREKFFNEFGAIVKEYDKERNYKFKKEKCINKIMELFMDRTCDGTLCVSYEVIEGRGRYFVNYAEQTEMKSMMELSEKKMQRQMSFLNKKTKQKPKAIDELMDMCEESEKVGLSRISDLARRFKEMLLEKKKYRTAIVDKNNVSQNGVAPNNDGYR